MSDVDDVAAALAQVVMLGSPPQEQALGDAVAVAVASRDAPPFDRLLDALEDALATALASIHEALELLQQERK